MKIWKIKIFFRAVGLGFVDSVPLLSSIKSNLNEAHDIASQDAGIGRINWIRLISAGLFVATFILYFTGRLTEENFLNLLNQIKNL